MKKWSAGRKGFLVVAALVISLLVLAACGEDGKEEGSLKSGGLFDFTGALAEFGPPIRNGASLGVDDCNEAGGNVQMVEADAGTDATIGVDAANQLIDVEGADV